MIFAQDINELIAQFPPMEAAFAYGSGVIEQSGYSQTIYKSPPMAASSVSESNLPMVDMIFVVNNSFTWHELNKIHNSSHYSTPVPMSARNIASIQDNYGAGLWYNTYIPMRTTRYPTRPMKYGVISKENFLADLINWKYLYVAGRLHKPVRTMQLPDTPTASSSSSSVIVEAVETNKAHAINTSLLLLPEIFSELDLFFTVASLSYTGDPRMGIGENPNKVENLVKPILPIYKELYKDTLLKLNPSVHWNASKASFQQDLSPDATWKVVESLPITLKQALSVTASPLIVGDKSDGRINMSLMLSTLPPRGASVKSALSSIVSRTARSQTLKGLLTAGVLKSSWYLAQKIGKRLGGLTK